MIVYELYTVVDDGVHGWVFLVGLLIAKHAGCCLISGVSQGRPFPEKKGGQRRASLTLNGSLHSYVINFKRRVEHSGIQCFIFELCGSAVDETADLERLAMETLLTGLWLLLVICCYSGETCMSLHCTQSGSKVLAPWLSYAIFIWV